MVSAVAGLGAGVHERGGQAMRVEQMVFCCDRRPGFDRGRIGPDHDLALGAELMADQGS